MATIIAIGQVPVDVAGLNIERHTLRFQNVGPTYIYLQRIPLRGAYTNVDQTHFEVALAPKGSPNGAPEVFETQSMLAYQAVSGPHVSEDSHGEGNGNCGENIGDGNGCPCHHNECHGLLSIQETIKTCIPIRLCNPHICY